MGLPLLDILGIGTKLIDKLIPDKAAADKAKLDLLTMQQNGSLEELHADTQLAQGQIDVDKIEAASPHLFVSGWRPFLGWTCGAIFVANYIGTPLLAWLSPAIGLPAPPRLDIGEVLPVLLGMLGLGGLRTAEKIKNVA